MRAVECAPGSVILAGNGERYPSDWAVANAIIVEKRWWRGPVVVDDHGRHWHGVAILSPETFELVEGVRGGVRYPAVRPVQGHSLAPEPAGDRTVGRLGVPVAAAATSNAVTTKPPLGGVPSGGLRQEGGVPLAPATG
jgi:hypothetical protein